MALFLYLHSSNRSRKTWGALHPRGKPRGFMRYIKEIMRLRWECGCSYRTIAQSIGVSDSTVGDCIQRIKEANLQWPLASDLTDEQLETKLYPCSKMKSNTLR